MSALTWGISSHQVLQIAVSNENTMIPSIAGSSKVNR